MPQTPAYPPPRSRPLAWLAEIGGDLPEEVRRRLRSMFFTSKVPLVVGALNTIAVALVAYGYVGRTVFLAIALADLALLGARLAILKRVDAPSGPVFLTGLVWAGLQASTIALVVLSGDAALSLLVLATGLAAIGGIVGRNFPAPRYAMAQVLMIDAGYKIPFALSHPEFVPLLAVQSVIFVLMNLGILRQHRRMAVEAIRREIESREKALTDPLTGLANRRALEEAFGRMTGRARALLYMDLDGFKHVNDRLGHGAGDALLQEVGRRLRATVGQGATLCRLGGDEFLVLTDGADLADTRALGARIVAAIAVPYEIEGGVLARVGASLGAALDGEGSLALPDMMARADQALYGAKTSGKGVCRLHEDESPSEPALSRVG